MSNLSNFTKKSEDASDEYKLGQYAREGCPELTPNLPKAERHKNNHTKGEKRGENDNGCYELSCATNQGYNKLRHSKWLRYKT